MIVDIEQNRSLSQLFFKISVQSAQDVHQSIVEAYLNSNELNKDELKNLISGFLKDKEKIHQSKTKSDKKTKIAYTPMQFHRIEPGPFTTKWPEPSYDITLTEPFEMMSTSVTQQMWLNVMGKLPLQLYDGPDYPVVNVSWWSILEFANRLSIQHNLPPTYNLSDIKDFTGDPALGTLKPNDEDAAGEKLKINASEGSIYFSKGYRLPTVYESIFVRTDRGRSTTKFFTGMNEENLKDYVWYDEDPGTPYHPVAELLPFIIDGKEFFDLMGNLLEYLNDVGTSCETLKTGVNPVSVNLKKEPKWCTRLLTWNYRLYKLYEINSNGFSWTSLESPLPITDPRSTPISFRLVRSLPKAIGN